jgi:hypothetical protein
MPGVGARGPRSRCADSGRRQHLRHRRTPHRLCRAGAGDPPIRADDPWRTPTPTREPGVEERPVLVGFRQSEGPDQPDLLRPETRRGQEPPGRSALLGPPPHRRPLMPWSATVAPTSTLAPTGRRHDRLGGLTGVIGTPLCISAASKLNDLSVILTRRRTRRSHEPLWAPGPIAQMDGNYQIDIRFPADMRSRLTLALTQGLTPVGCNRHSQRENSDRHRRATQSCGGSRSVVCREYLLKLAHRWRPARRNENSKRPADHTTVRGPPSCLAQCYLPAAWKRATKSAGTRPRAETSMPCDSAH